jgi:hypothetical protein
MNANWIMEPLAVYGAMAVIAAATLYTFLSGRAGVRRVIARSEQHARDLEKKVAGLEERIAALAAEAEQEARANAVAAAPLLRGINVQKRSEALRMCRRGADDELIASRLGLSRADALLLHKVHQALAGDSPEPLPGPLEERPAAFARSPLM